MRYIYSIVMLLAVLAAPSAHAALVYSLDIVGDVSDVRAGSTVALQLVLTEAGVNDNGQANSLGAGNGLFGFGIEIAASGGDATLSNLKTPGYAPAFGNAGNVVITPRSLSLNMTSEDFSTSPFQGETSQRQTIATFDVTYATTDTLLTVSDVGSGFPVSLGAGFSTSAIPESQIEFGSLNVSAVPEPSSYVLFAFAAVANSCLRKRRKRAFN